MEAGRNCIEKCGMWQRELKLGSRLHGSGQGAMEKLTREDAILKFIEGVRLQKCRESVGWTLQGECRYGIFVRYLGR